MPAKRRASAQAAGDKAVQKSATGVQGRQEPATRRRGRSKKGAGSGTTAAAAAAGAVAAASPATADEVEAEGVQLPNKKRRGKEIMVPEPAQHCFCLDQLGVRIGTSGYSYSHWKQGYYGGLPQRLEFDAYSKEFDMVELNATFYRFFDESTWDGWRDRAAAVRPSFQYVVKASQFYTHKKRLNVDDVFTQNWARFWERCERLRPHLGPVLFQFPANFRTTSAGKGGEAISNIDKLRRLGQVLPAGEKFVFEFRDISWYCQEVYDVLRQYNWCLAVVHCTDGPHRQKLEKDEGGWIGTLHPGPNPRPDQYPLDCCTWGAYVRFHGSTGQYQGAHGAKEMAKWAGWAQKWRAQGRQVWLAFNNDAVDEEGQLPPAISDCRDLAAALRSNGVWPS